MPTKSSIAKKLIVLALLSICYTRYISRPVLAQTDPQYATASATATIPSTTPTTSDTNPPSAPILVRPEDGTYSSDNKREFVWRTSSDPDSNTVIYTLYLNGVATYLGISNIGNSSGAGYTAFIDNNMVRLTPSNPIPDGEYTWYVTASDLSGNTAYSTSWFLTIDTSPPSLEVISLENYQYPLITLGSNFDIEGPRNIDFTLKTEPFARIQVTIQDLSPPLIHTTTLDGLAYLYQYLEPGTYDVIILSTDRAGNTSFIPDFTITITQASFEIPIPDVTIPGIIEPTPSEPSKTVSIPYTPIDLPSLPATISRISTRVGLATYIIILLAITVLMLLFLLFKRRNNLTLLNERGLPIEEATLLHDCSVEGHPLPKQTYKLRKHHHGRLYIKNLARFSNLSITHSNMVIDLSISVNQKRYLLKIE